MILSNDINVCQGITDKFSTTRNQIKTVRETKDLNEVGVALTSFKPELVIIDDDMLHPDSPLVLQIVKHINENVSVIFLTSDPGIELGRRITQLGVQFYTHKPIEANELCEAVFSIIKKLKKQRLTF